MVSIRKFKRFVFKDLIDFEDTEEKINYKGAWANIITVKYISRPGKKDPKKFREDLEKAVWYLNRELKKE